MKKIIFILPFLLAGCVTTYEITEEQETRFETKVNIREYNKLLSDYKIKPTFSSIISYPNGEYPEGLFYSADGYGVNYDGDIGVTDVKLGFAVYKYDSDSFIKAIDKFLKWDTQALEASDSFTKLILETKGKDKSGIKVFNRFGFHSGNQYVNYFTIKVCVHSNMLNKTSCSHRGNLDKVSALALKQEINMFVSGDIKQEDTASKYN